MASKGDHESTARSLCIYINGDLRPVEFASYLQFIVIRLMAYTLYVSDMCNVTQLTRQFN